MRLPPPRSTLTATLFPYTTLLHSLPPPAMHHPHCLERRGARGPPHVHLLHPNGAISYRRIGARSGAAGEIVPRQRRGGRRRRTARQHERERAIDRIMPFPTRRRPARQSSTPILNGSWRTGCCASAVVPRAATAHRTDAR